MKAAPSERLQKYQRESGLVSVPIAEFQRGFFPIGPIIVSTLVQSRKGAGRILRRRRFLEREGTPSFQMFVQTFIYLVNFLTVKYEDFRRLRYNERDSWVKDLVFR